MRNEDRNSIRGDVIPCWVLMVACHFFMLASIQSDLKPKTYNISTQNLKK